MRLISALAEAEAEADNMANEAAQQLALLDQSRDEFISLSQQQAAQAERVATAPGGNIARGTGIGIIDIFTAPSRRRKQQQANLASAQQRADSLVDASGVDLSGFTPSEVEGLQRLAIQDFDAFEAQVQQIENVQGLNQTPLQRQQLLNAQQQFQQNASGELRAVAAAGRLENAQKLEFNKAVNSETSSLRGQYHQAIRPVVDMLQSVQLARGQMELGTPEAAFNSARLFIQQLDKSMVTNPELEAIMQQPGVAGQVDNMISWLSGQGKFDANSRRRMVQAMSAIAQVMKSHGDGIVEDMTALIEGNALPIDAANVITMGGFANRQFDLSTPQGSLQITKEKVDPSLLPPGVTQIQ